jgi:hypothetical protein
VNHRNSTTKSETLKRAWFVDPSLAFSSVETYAKLSLYQFNIMIAGGEIVFIVIVVILSVIILAVAARKIITYTTSRRLPKQSSMTHIDDLDDINIPQETKSPAQIALEERPKVYLERARSLNLNSRPEVNFNETNTVIEGRVRSDSYHSDVSNITTGTFSLTRREFSEEKEINVFDAQDTEIEGSHV